MVSSTAANVDEYLQSLEPEWAEALAQLRKAIFDIAPSATETMQYRMPTYQVGPGILCAMAAQKQYMSLYVETGILDRHRDKLTHLNLGKSCIRFRTIEALPMNVVKAILTETVVRLDAVTAEGDQ